MEGKTSKHHIKPAHEEPLQPAPLSIPADKSVVKVSPAHAPRGPMGQKYLASGIKMGMRLFEEEQPCSQKPVTARDYETLGFVVKGRAELHLEGQMVLLEPGDSWLVPKGAHHTYKILEPFTAVECTSPPAFIHNRDEPPPAP